MKDPLDPEFQKELAINMLREKRWQHWYVCSKKIGIDKIV